LGRYEGGLSEVFWVRDLKANSNAKAKAKAKAMQEGRGKTR
jgi:hypothetical protein